MDHYEVLGVPKNATEADIKKAYRRNAAKHHPDRGGSKERMAEANAAFACLSDPDRRARYDAGQGDTPMKRTPDDEAQKMLHEVLRHALDTYADNPIELARQCLAQSLADGSGKVKDLRDKTARLKKHRGRIKVKTAQTAAFDVIDSMVSQNESLIAVIDNLLVVVRLTIELLSAYDYELPQPAMRAMDKQRDMNAMFDAAVFGRFGSAPWRNL